MTDYYHCIIRIIFEGNTLEWIDSYFTKSLAYIQAQYYEDITGDEVLDFIKARIKGITKR